MKRNNVIRVLLLLVICWFSLDSLAQRTPIIGKLSKLDLKFMAQQRDTLQDLAATNLGRQFSGNRDRHLELLQSLLDKNLVRADQTRELQAMGVIMGDLLSAEFDLHWVIYEDNLGRTRALRYRDSDNFLFPITMISRRREVGNQATVPDIYQKASDIIAANIPALPFQ
jgi:hypothetical protein